MRTMKNFAAQQLSMQQMMQILGGKYQSVFMQQMDVSSIVLPLTV